MNNYDLEKTNSAISKIKENEIAEAQTILSKINNSKSYFNAALAQKK